MAQQASSSSSSSSSFRYDVFLSFRGQDTREGFTGYLCRALRGKGIHTFIDDEELQRGEEITPSLAKAIEESRIAILVLSTDYASSSFCLDELVKIIECIKGNDRLVLPVFYKVDPSHVRHQIGSFGEAMDKHEKRFKDDMDKVQKWKEALHQIANLSGYHFKHGDGYEHEFIGKIVEAISRNTGRGVLPVADFLVGLGPKVLEINSLLDIGSNDGVQMVGIHGIGGIGKTTLARAVSNRVADHFEGLCFLENVRENSNKHGLVHLQSRLLSELLGGEKIKLTNVQQGISIIQHRLQKKKVLLILDDVDKQEQLRAIVGNPNWFGPGSRVIITTRDTLLLASYGVGRTYEVEGLNYAEALELLAWKAFKTVNVSPSYMDVLNRVVTYARGLPLALEVIGSNLFEKSIEEWKSAINQYERIPNNKIYKILKVSFDALEEEEQSVFLDIACCFKGYALAEVEDLLHAHHEDCVKYHIGVLVDKCLIKIDQVCKVTLHDLIEDMGKEIVRQESPKAPGKRSRLWCHEDIVQVLEDNQGTGEIEIIHLYFPSSEEEPKVEWDGKAFKKMKNLKTLIIRSGHFSEVPKYLPNSLRVLEWWSYPSQCLPSNFYSKKLSILKLPNNFFMSLELASLLKKFVNLKVLNFDYNMCLTQIPDVSGLPNLEELSFKYCVNLMTIHDSVGFLDKLKILSVHSCCKLRSFPPIKLPSLEELHLSYCSSLENFPEILGKMENITQLRVARTSIKDLPCSFQNLCRLRQLDLFSNEIYRMPRVIVMMSELADITIETWNKELLSLEQDEVEEIVSSVGSSKVKSLRLSCCNQLDDFFLIGLAWFANLKELDLSYSYFTTLPECIKECGFLRKLDVDCCLSLQEIRGIPPNLKHFSALNCRSLTCSCSSMLLNQELHEAGNTMFLLPAASIPEWFDHHSRGPTISFLFREKFPALVLYLVIGQMNKNLPWVHISLTLIINGNTRFPHIGEGQYLLFDMDHILLFDLQRIKFNDKLDEALLENQWNHAEVSYTAINQLIDDMSKFPIENFLKESGIHVFKQKSNMEDIRFVNPYKRRKLDDGLYSPES